MKGSSREHLFSKVIDEFLNSPKFLGYAPATQQMWKRELLLAQHPDVLGGKPTETIRPALVQQFLDCLADRPAKQRTTRAALKALERWALVRDKVAFPITTGTEVYGELGQYRPWTDDQVALAEKHAAPLLARAVTLGANTGQRGSDLVRMGWADIEAYQGRLGINLTTKKTGRRLWLPMTAALEAAIATWEKRPGPFLVNDDGTLLKDMARNILPNKWYRERDTNPALAPLRGLSMHGLRATAVVRLRRAGAKETQIADCIGMSESMVAHYCKLSDQRDNALAAIIHLDRMRDVSQRKA